MSIWIRFKKSRYMRKLVLIMYRVFCTLPPKKNVIIFESYLGKQFSCNPRAIYEYISENHPQYELYWSVDIHYMNNFNGKNIQCIERFSPKWFYYMARAEFWIFNSRTPVWLTKSKHTKYLQTWHGTPLKKLGADMDEVHMPGTTTEKYKKNFYKESRKWDYLISPNSYSSEIFRSAFWFDKRLIESGYPRNDFLFKANNAETIRDLKQKYNIPLDKKVILYAPTWRDNQFYGKGKYKFDLKLDLNGLREKYEEDYVILMRMHYLVAENFDLSAYKGFVYDFSNHEDIRELYIMADLLITDYSSVFFDYAILNRPMIFFAYDIEEYRDELRGFYFDFEKEAPGPIAKNMDELYEALNKITYRDNTSFENEEFSNFLGKFNKWEQGYASEKVAEVILDKQNK